MRTVGYPAPGRIKPSELAGLHWNPPELGRGICSLLRAYHGAATQTATSGALAGVASGPQEAPFSPRNCAGLRVGPQ
jgi:hypothetical protein